MLGALIGGVLGHQIGHGRGRDAATAAGVGRRRGRRWAAGQAPRRLCRGAAAPVHGAALRDALPAKTWEERTDGYRVTYVYNGRRQVTEMPNRPGDRIRVRVDVSPAE